MDNEQDSNAAPNTIRTTVELAYEQDRTQGRYSAVAISKLADVSDTAVRKAFKAIKQVVSEGFLVVSGKYTEMCKTLMLSYFQRPADMNGAQWINELQSIVGAMPLSNVSGPTVKTSDYWRQRQDEAQQQSTALSVRSSSLLSYVVAEMDADDLGDEDSFDVELATLKEQAYERELRRQIAVIEGRNQARQDIRSKI